MKKFKTVNNWVCKHFVIALSNGNYRQCCFLAYNTFDDCLSSDVQYRMLNYLISSISFDTLRLLLDTLPFEVRSYIMSKSLEKPLFYEKNQ